MRGDPSGPCLLQPGVAVVESEDEDSTTSLDFNTSDFLPFWDYTEVTNKYRILLLCWHPKEDPRASI